MLKDTLPLSFNPFLLFIGLHQNGLYVSKLMENHKKLRHDRGNLYLWFKILELSFYNSRTEIIKYKQTNKERTKLKQSEHHTNITKITTKNTHFNLNYCGFQFYDSNNISSNILRQVILVPWPSAHTSLKSLLFVTYHFVTQFQSPKKSFRYLRQVIPDPLCTAHANES